MIPIVFDRDRAALILDCLTTGEEIPSPAGGWNAYEMLQLAGACFFATMTHGPALYAAEWAGQHREHQEANEERLFSDLHAAVEFIGQLSMLVKDGEFDGTFERMVRAMVGTQDGNPTVVPISGFRQ